MPRDVGAPDLLLDEIFGSVETGLCLLASDGLVLRANDAWLRGMHLTAEGVVGHPLAAKAPAHAALLASLKDEKPGRAVALPPRARAEGGTWLERAVVVPLGEETGILLTAKGSAEAAQDTTYRTAFQNIQDYVVLLEAVRDATGAVVDWVVFDANESVVKAMERPRSALIGRAMSEVVPARLAEVKARYERVLSTGEPLRTDDHLLGRDFLLTVFRVDENRIGASALDITSLKAVEASLRRSENQLRLLVEHTPADVAMFDREVRYLAASRRYASSFGIDASNLIGRCHYDVLPEIPQRWKDIHSRCLAGATERSAEDEFIRPDGHVDWVEWEIQPWREADGTVGGFVLFSLMITERKEAADRLLAAKERLAVTLESIGDAVIATDETGCVTLFNRVAEELTGWRAVDAVGRPLPEVFEAVSEETGATVANPAERVLREGVTVALADHAILVARNGRRRPIADSAAPIRDASGATAGAVLVFRDQTEERAAEEALLRSRAEFISLVEKLPIGVFVTADGVMVYANPAFVSLLGGEHQRQLVGRRPEELTAPGGEPGPVARQEWTVLAPEGRKVSLACDSVREVDFGGRPASLWTCRDLSELRAVQAQLIHADRLASLGMLAAGVAHEINNPLTYVIGALELIEERLVPVFSSSSTEGLGEIVSSVREARQGAQRVKTIVGDLRRFSRPENDERAALELPRLMDSAIGMATHEIDHRARLVRDYGPIPTVVGNEARLSQVFLNLLVNAAHAIPEGHAPDHEIRVVLSTDTAGKAVVEVRDTGVGIPPQLMDRIFDPFFTTKIGSGTGLGLAISRNTVTALGGAITLESTPGAGTRARVILPAGAHERSAPKKPASSPTSKRRAKILVVDDEATICKLMHRVLDSEHDVLTEVRAVDALARFRSGERFDVVFCDLMMPEMTGFELFRLVEESHPEQARSFVFTTGGTFTQGAEEFLREVPNPRLNKPFAIRELRALVHEIAEGALAAGTRGN